MADLDAAQSAALVQRQSAQDLADIVLVLQRDNALNGEFVDPIAGIEDADEKKAAEEARDEVIANSQLLAEVPSNAPTEEELAGNKEASEAAGESEAEAAPKATKEKAAAAQGS